MYREQLVRRRVATLVAAILLLVAVVGLVVEAGKEPRLNGSERGPGLLATGSISGQVYDEVDSSPLAGVQVYAVSHGTYPYPSSATYTATTGLDGQYELAGLDPGTYTVWVEDTAGHFGEIYNDTDNPWSPDPVSVSSGGVTSGIDFALAAAGALSGHVYGPDGVTPLAGMSISLSGPWWGSATTSSDGSYVIENLVPGDYLVIVEDDNGDYVSEYYDDAQSYWAASLVTVIGGQETTAIDFVLDLAGSISGNVYADDGVTPLADVSVKASGGGMNRTAQTGSDGSYQVTGLAPGDYLVLAGPTDDYAGEYYGGTPDFEEAVEVTVIGGQDTADIDFSLVRAGSISGHVYAEDGPKPLPGIMVFIGAFDGNSLTNGPYYTDVDGAYSATGLPPDDYKVWIMGYALEGWVGETYANPERVPVVADQETSGIDFWLEPYYVAGNCVDSYEPDNACGEATSFSVPSWQWDHGFCEAGDQDWLVFQGVAGHNYVIETYSLETACDTYMNLYDQNQTLLTSDDDGGDGLGSRISYTATDDGSYYVMVRHYDASRYGDHTSYTISVEQERGSISGYVYAEDGVTPLEGVYVSTYDDAGGMYWAQTDASGAYTIVDLPAETYEQVQAGDWFAYGWEIYQEATTCDGATPITVPNGQGVSGIDFTLGPAGHITGYVYDDNGNPLADVEVHAIPFDGPYTESFDPYALTCGYGMTMADGSYTMRGLAATDYLVFADPWQGFMMPESSLLGVYEDHYSLDMADRVAVGVGETEADINLTLRWPGSVSGHVYLEDGSTPAVGVTVTVASYEGMDASAVTGMDGAYLVEDLWPVEYLASVDTGDEGLVATVRSVDVHSGQETQWVDFSLLTNNHGAITGRILAEDGVTPLKGITVWAEREPKYDWHNAAITGEDGRFAIQALVPGGYNLWAAPVWPTYDLQEYPNPVCVNLGMETDAGDMALLKNGSISGHVYASDGSTPLQGVEVEALEVGMPLGDRFGGRTNTDADGSFVVRGVSPGEFHLQAKSSDPTYSSEYFDGVHGEDTATAVLVESGQVADGIVFDLDPSGSISGHVYAQDGVTPLEGAEVSAHGTGQYYPPAISAADGSYVVSGLEWADYTVYASTQDGYAWHRDPVIAVDETPVSGIDLVLEPYGSISGTMYDKDGAPMTDGYVGGFSRDAYWAWAESPTGPDGSYVLEGLPAGEYIVQFYASPGYHSGNFYPDAFHSDFCEIIVVQSGVVVQDIDIHPGRYGTLSGHVSVADGATPLWGMQVRAMSTDGLDRKLATDEQGYYFFDRLPSGQYTVSAESLCDEYVMEWYSDTLTVAEAWTVEVLDAEDKTGIDFSLEQAPEPPFDCSAVTEIPCSECEALVAFYEATGGDSWTNNDNWLQNDEPSTWRGICVSDGHVSELGQYGQLSNNNLVGSLPESIGNLPYLTDIYLYNNPGLTGNIPNAIGMLSHLHTLIAMSNGFSGSIPTQLGQATNLVSLYLNGNALEGPIPPEIGNLTSIGELMLQNNHLSGALPSEMGSLVALTALDVSNNAFSGDVPTQLASLVSLGEYPGGGSAPVDIGYNALTASDLAVRDFLTDKDPDWADTQTVAPQDILVTGTTTDTMTLTWTPITYTADGGYYQVDAVDALGVQATVSTQTADKSAAGCVVQGLAPGTTYSITVRTHTPAHDDQPNDLWSVPSQAITGETDVDLATISLNLQEGWNLISFDIDPLCDGQPISLVADVLESIDGSYEAVLGYDGGGKSYYPQLPPAFNDLKDLDCLHGYWLKMNADSTLSMSGSPIPDDHPISLQEGWNLVSYLPDMDITVADALISIDGQYEAVLGYDGGGQSFYPQLPPQFNDLKCLQVNHGYWIKATSAVTLTYPTSGTCVGMTGLSAYASTPSTRVTATNVWCDVYSLASDCEASALPTGSIVEAFDPDGVLCGMARMEFAGQWVVMHVYGDDALTEDLDEGAVDGDVLTFRINGAEAKTAEEIIWQARGLEEVGLSADDCGACVSLPLLRK